MASYGAARLADPWQALSIARDRREGARRSGNRLRYQREEDEEADRLAANDLLTNRVAGFVAQEANRVPLSE